jgi:hypothetical protein
MRAVELAGERSAGGQPLGRIGVPERLGEASIDRLALADGEVADDVRLRLLCRVQRWIRARSPNTLTTALRSALEPSNTATMPCS